MIRLFRAVRSSCHVSLMAWALPGERTDLPMAYYHEGAEFRQRVVDRWQSLALTPRIRPKQGRRVRRQAFHCLLRRGGRRTATRQRWERVNIMEGNPKTARGQTK